MKACIMTKMDRTPLGSMKEVRKCHGNVAVVCVMLPEKIIGLGVTLEQESATFWMSHATL